MKINQQSQSDPKGIDQISDIFGKNDETIASPKLKKKQSNSKKDDE